jgi:hypothetical protein
VALKLPRLPTNQQLVDANGFPTTVFVLWWAEFAEQIEASINGIALALEAAGIALDAADAAQTAADNADAAAAAAQGAANEVNAASALANSYVTGLTVTATDAGADVTIALSAHTRVYGDGTSVSVNAGNLTGQPYSTTVYVYYDQASRAGGAVTYVATLNIDDVAQLNDRHSVASVITPAAAAPPNNGGGVRPPGGNFAEP